MRETIKFVATLGGILIGVVVLGVIASMVDDDYESEIDQDRFGTLTDKGKTHSIIGNQTVTEYYVVIDYHKTSFSDATTLTYRSTIKSGYVYEIYQNSVGDRVRLLRDGERV